MSTPIERELATATGARYEFARAGYPLDELDYHARRAWHSAELAQFIIDAERPYLLVDVVKLAKAMESAFLLAELRAAARQQWRVYPRGRPNRAERRKDQ